MYGHTPRGYDAVARGLARRRAIRRALLTPGDRHVDTIVRDCLDRRLDPDTTRIRLLVASDIARVLVDGSRS